MVHSAAGVALPPGGLVVRPPLRAPHHTASIVAMVGGGTSAMRPGEASLAHEGVLLLDEMAEFHPSVLDGLRQPLEEGVIRVIRAKASVEFPSRFLLVGTMNPCPCGSAEPNLCTCGETGSLRYLRRISGPLLDRFDLRLEVHRPSVEELLGGPPAESSAAVAARVARARGVMHERAGVLNADIPAHRLDELAPAHAGGHAAAAARARAQPADGSGPAPGSSCGPHAVRPDAAAGRSGRRPVGERGAEPSHRPVPAGAEGGMSDVTRGDVTGDDLPQEAYAATLAGLGPLGPARLERLFGHWSPSEAWAAVRAGRAAGVWGRGEAPATVRKAEQALARAVADRRSGSVLGPVPGGERRGAAARRVRLPRGAGRRPVAPTRAVRPGRCRRPRRPTRHDRGHPQRHGGRAGGGRRARGWPGPGRRPGRVGLGSWHRRLGPPGRAVGRGRRSARRRWWPAAPTWCTRPSTAHCGRRSSSGACCSARCPLAPRPTPCASRCATASSRPWARCSSWSSPSARAARSSPSRRPSSGGGRVFAVPGSPRNEAAEGTNDLLIDGADPVVRSADLLMALGFERPVVRRRTVVRGGRTARGASRPLDAPAPRRRAPPSRHPGPALRSIARRGRVDAGPPHRLRSGLPARRAGSSAAPGQWDDTDEAVPSTRWGGSSTTTSVR